MFCKERNLSKIVTIYNTNWFSLIVAWQNRSSCRATSYTKFRAWSNGCDLPRDKSHWNRWLFARAIFAIASPCDRSSCRATKSLTVNERGLGWMGRNSRESGSAYLIFAWKNRFILMWIQMVHFIPVKNFREKGNTFRGITRFPIQLQFSKISVPLVSNKMPGFLRQHFREERCLET